MRGAQVDEVDIGRLERSNRSLDELGEMAKQVTRVILDRAWRYDRLGINPVRQMEEAERWKKAETLPPSLCGADHRRFALFEADDVLLEGSFLAGLAGRVGALEDLARFSGNQILSDEERTGAIAALFTGVHMETFEEAARSMPLMEGAVDTVIALRRAGYVVGVVTEGFQFAAEIVRRRVFADFSVAHLLRFRNRQCTGEVVLSPAMVDQGGCAAHSCCKANVVRHLEDTAGLIREESLAVGHEESDICMLRQVGMPVAFRPRTPAVAEAARHTIESLTALLDVLEVERMPARASTGAGSRLGEGGR